TEVDHPGAAADGDAAQRGGVAGVELRLRLRRARKSGGERQGGGCDAQKTQHVEPDRQHERVLLARNQGRQHVGALSVTQGAKATKLPQNTALTTDSSALDLGAECVLSMKGGAVCRQALA